MFLERKTELGEKGVSLLIGLGRGNECDLHTMDTGVLVDVNLREDDLLLVRNVFEESSDEEGDQLRVVAETMARP